MRSSSCTIVMTARFLLTVALCMATGFLGTDTPASASETPAADDDNVVDRGERGELAKDTESAALRARTRPDIREGSFRLPAALELPPGHALVVGPVQPIALASGDFDEDGVADLISGYMSPDGNVLTLHRGNVDSIFPHSPEARHRRLEGTFSDEPFLPSVQVFQAPVRPDFLAAGDFDNDGHWDVVLAASGEASLYLLPGDGNGGLQQAEQLELAGAVTTLVAGEVNRADGLVDLVLGVRGPGGPALLVFEGPEGALRSEAEVLPMSAPPTALLLARLGDGPWHDLAVAAGEELFLVRGRDRRLVLDEPQRAEVAPPVVDRIEMPSVIEALAWGDFAWEPIATRELALLLEDGTIRLLGLAQTENEDLDLSWEMIGERDVLVPRTHATESSSVRQLLPVRISGSPTEDLAILDAIDGRLDVLAGMVREDAAAYLAHPGMVVSVELQEPPIAALGMRLNRDALTDLVLLQQGMDGPLVVETELLATITVNSDADGTATDGTCTLREALNNSNSDGDTTGGDCAAGAGADAIEFNIGGGGSTATIAPTSALPTITDSVTIDGTTQGCASPPCILLDGVFAGADVNGLVLSTGSSTVRGLAIGRFTSNGILAESPGNILEGNFLGTDITGTSVLGNTLWGALLTSPNNLVGGTVADARNVMSGNGFDGVAMQSAGASQNEVLGNYIGTNVSGTVALGNIFDGVFILDASDNTIGGTSAGSRNILSGNGSRGVFIWIEGGSSAGNQVLGNYIGTDVTGTVDLGNGTRGVQITDGQDNTIGGTSVGAGNIISANGTTGVYLNGANATANLVLGNRIGTDITGTAPLGNVVRGVLVDAGSSNNVVGGVSPGAGNLISANGTDGIKIASGATANQLLGNFIGTDVTGTVDLGNNFAGIEIEAAPNNTIGGTVNGAGNVISGNDQMGVLIELNGATQNSVLGNFIGTDVTGTIDLGNALMGVLISETSNNTIGGTTPGARNVISGNDQEGVLIQGASDNDVIGNFIGTQADGISPLGNMFHGILVLDTSSNNSIGGTGVTPGICDGPCNRIGFTTDPGDDAVRIQVGSGNGNAILGNSIFASAELGIDLGPSGMTPNDLGDPDTGPNTLQNFPVLSLADATPAGATVDGSLNSSPNRPFRIEFFASTACDASGHGEGSRFLGSTNVVTDVTGNVSFSAALTGPVSDGEAITATASSMGLSVSTSEFSECFAATCLASAVFGQTVVAQDKNTLSWAAPDHVRYVKGNLANVSSYLITATGELPAATSLDISSDNPAAGSGLYYLIRSTACGIWQTTPGAEPGRDVLP